MEKTKNKCALCLQQTTLRKSHIFPNFMWRSFSEQGETIQSFNTDKSYSQNRPTGVYEKLLCENCENILQQYEDYARPFLERVKDIKPKEAYTHTFKSTEKIKGVNNKYNYEKLKLLFLSILWRSSVSSMPEYSNCDLGSHYNEALRRLIFNSQTPPKDIFPIAIRCYNIENENYDAIHIPPLKQKLKVFHKSCYFFVSHGLGVHIGVGSFKNYKQEAFMQGKGFDQDTLTVSYLSFQQDRLAIKTYSDFLKKSPGLQKI